MKKLYTSILIFFLFSFLSFSVADSDIKLYDASMYFIDSVSITFFWDPPLNITPDGYDIELKCIDTNQVYKKTTVLTTVSYNRPRVGHFILYVRGYIFVNSVKQYLDWASSDSPSQAQIWINGELKRQGGWLIYWRTPAPTEPVID